MKEGITTVKRPKITPEMLMELPRKTRRYYAKIIGKKIPGIHLELKKKVN